MPELLLSCKDVTKSFGATPLFERLSFGIFDGDHVGLVGPNGSGKSTLLEILAGREPPTDGVRSARKRLRLGFVEQDPVFPAGATVSGVLTTAACADHLDPREVEGRVAVVMGKAGFDSGEVAIDTLSGGWKKRLAIAQELAREPELLLLDEPTNHLDLEGILWLEELLRREPRAFLAVSHDRYFLEAAAQRMIELNRVFASGMFEVQGTYSRFLEKKDEHLAGQAAYHASLRNRVRRELEWLSRKARARTRKGQARVDAAGRIREELKDLDARTRAATVDIDFTGTSRKTRRLVTAAAVARRVGGRTLFRDLDLVLSPGSRLGLLGANGSGKTTLLRLLADLDHPDSGTIDRAPDLKIVMFDQHRARLDPAVSLRRTLAPLGDGIVFQGRSIHVAGWAQRFLFRSEQLDMHVGRLSGGEQARVVIARLMLEPADLLLLDEPTNDLDIPTLEVLEESLLEFPGALVLVTHDRYLLDRVSTSLLALDGRGSATPYADYAQWEAARSVDTQDQVPRRSLGSGKTTAKRERSREQRNRLGYLEQREWDQMEMRILEAERRLDACAASAADPEVASDHEALVERHTAVASAQEEVDRLYARWVELEAKIKP